MPQARDRTRKSGVQASGEVTFKFGENIARGIGVRTNPLFTARCQDVVGARTADNPLIITKETFNLTPLNGSASKSNWVRTYNDVGPAVCKLYATLPPADSVNSLRVEALKRTNPSRPVADLAVSAAELRDLPKLAESVGQTMLRKGAGNYLSIQFGWTPLVSDLVDMMDFQKHVANRVDELQRLYSGHGLKRRVYLGTQTATRTITDFGVSGVLGKLFKGQGSATSTRRSWATVRYKPIIGKCPSADHAMRRQALRAIYGLTVDPSTAWNLIPFSWMVDWFSNAGDWLEANRNIVGAYVDSCCVMTHTRREVRITTVVPPLDCEGISGGTQHNVSETKNRYPGVMTLPELDLGAAISPKQASILGALAITSIPKDLLR